MLARYGVAIDVATQKCTKCFRGDDRTPSLHPWASSCSIRSPPLPHPRYSYLWCFMALEKELETYKRKLPELATEEGKFVLIQGDNLVGIYGTYEDALAAGYQHFNLEPFLVEHIQTVEQRQGFTRIL